MAALVPDGDKLGEIHALLGQPDPAHFHVFAADLHILVPLLGIEEQNLRHAAGARSAEEAGNRRVFVQGQRIQIGGADADGDVEGFGDERQKARDVLLLGAGRRRGEIHFH